MGEKWSHSQFIGYTQLKETSDWYRALVVEVLVVEVLVEVLVEVEVLVDVVLSGQSQTSCKYLGVAQVTRGSRAGFIS